MKALRMTESDGSTMWMQSGGGTTLYMYTSESYKQPMYGAAHAYGPPRSSLMVQDVGLRAATRPMA